MTTSTLEKPSAVDTDGIDLQSAVKVLDYKQYDSRYLKPADAHNIKIAFVQPLIPDGNYLPNLGIMYLSAVLIKEGYDVRVFDENIHDNVPGMIKTFQPALIGFTCVTAALGASCRMAAQLKEHLPEATIVVGGPHMSAVPKETIRDNPIIDFGFIGEAEISFPTFCNTYVRDKKQSIEDVSSIPGLVYRDAEGEVQSNRSAPFLEGRAMDDLPFPAWHLLPMEDIFRKATHGLFSRGKRIMPVMTTRGCPNYCGFCCRVMGFTFRAQELSRVVTEIKWLYETYQIDELYFEDDTFTQDPVRAHALLDAVIGLNLPIYVKFANGLRADKVDRDLLDKMKQAGVYWVGFGIESGSPHTQALMKKKLDLDLAAANVRLAKEMGFKVGSNCIIGYPGETKESIKESINYFLDLNLDSFAVVTCVPFPGTTAWQVCEKEGWLSPRADNYDNYWFEVFKVTPLVSMPHLTSKELSRAIFWVYVRFYILNVRRLMLVSRMVMKKKINGIVDLPLFSWVRMLRANSAMRPTRTG
jgi:radical SAM superfamily enzyme YgiQ (UPF0313 family)